MKRRAILNEVWDIGATVTSEVTVDKYEEIYKHLECSTFDVVFIEHEGRRFNVFCDDEGMLKSGNFGRLIEGYPQLLFGNLLFMGDVDDEGETLGLPDDVTAGMIHDMISDAHWRIR